MPHTLDELKAIPVARAANDRPGGTPSHKYPDPDLGHALIPKERYTSAEFVTREWDRMWTKVWLGGGREEVIPDPGDWITHELGTESFIFVRQDDGGIKGFFNVCPHRGNRLLQKDSSGSAATFTCGYHAWEFNTDGSEHNIPDRETFPQLASCAAMHLKTVRVDCWGGFFFFTMNPDAPPLLDYLGEIPRHLDPYRFQDQKLIEWKTIEWDCNWKTCVDAFNETYHVEQTHPELLSWLDDWNVQIDVFGKHSRYLIPFMTPSPKYGDQHSPSDILRGGAEAMGIDPQMFEGNPRGLRLEMQRLKRSMQDDTLYPYQDLNDDQLTDDYHYSIFPHMVMNVYPEALLLFFARPHPTDPNKMFYDVMNFTHLPVDEPYHLPEHVTFKHGQISLGQVLDQDAHNLPRVQEGMNSRAYEGLIVGTQELRIRHFHAVLMDYVEGDGTAW
jgi:phenylpropionate dioxygenase-like ring-hydroxylating dioxygenase large terminal subunit